MMTPKPAALTAAVLLAVIAFALLRTESDSNHEARPSMTLQTEVADTVPLDRGTLEAVEGTSQSTKRNSESPGPRQPTPQEIEQYFAAMDRDSEQVLAAVRLGALGREAYGEGYDALLDQFALEQIRGSLTAGVETRRNSFCGLGSPDELDQLKERLGSEAPVLATELDGLLAEASTLAESAVEFAEASWTSGVGVAAFNEDEEPVEFWRGAVPSSTAPGLLEFSSMTATGDREFKLTFNSADHPQLELQLAEFKKKKDAFWGSVSQL